MRTVLSLPATFLPLNGSERASRCIGVALLLLLGFANCKTAFASPSASGPADQMNIVVILTDDQRWDTLRSTPSISKLASTGVSFTNAYVSQPVCGPSRASMLSGGYRPINTGIISNNQDISPLAALNDRNTIAVRLQAAGYETFFIGKYINGYAGNPAMKKYVAPGWSRWLASNQSGVRAWNDFTVTIGSSGGTPAIGSVVGPVPEYVTTYQAEEILSFLDGVGDRPFFVFWTPLVPHPPSPPAPGDERLFTSFLYRGRAWGEVDLSDKPVWVRDPKRNIRTKQPYDDFPRRQLRSLQEVDRGVAAIVEKVQAIGKADRTVYLVASDNGYQWGEHGLLGKGMPYEESLRVPLVAFGAGIRPAVDGRMVLTDLDLGPTILELAGVGTGAADGLSLRPVLAGQRPAWRDLMLFECWGDGSDGPFATWAALRTQRWKYIKQANGEEELYDLLKDPYEKESRHDDSAYDGIRLDLAARLDSQKSLAALGNGTPREARVGVFYRLQLAAWGGSGNYRWVIESGELPAGLVLDANKGLISGTPTRVGVTNVVISVQDGTKGTHSGQPRRHRRTYKFTIK